jgi:methoxymalonate biosynthesis acyl carrier protein
MDQKTQIRRFLGRFFRANFADEDDIFGMGFVNSLFAMQLVLYIEKEFCIRVENQDLVISNFNSVDNIDAFVTRKHGAATVDVLQQGV